MISNGEVEQGKITKSVLVIDEAQDMDEHEFALVKALMSINDDMRVIAVGDDDQNIYEFRGSNSEHLRTLIDHYGATKYEMTENYRSKTNVISLANAFAESITDRMKSEPIEAVTEEKGAVRITHHASINMEEAIVPAIYDPSRIDVQIMVESEEAIATARRIIAKEGIFAGMSSGAAMLAAIKTAEMIEKGNIVVVFPDRAEKYLSTSMFETL